MDSSVYEAMVRMAQNFKMGKPLIKGQGNWGSIDGDSAAAMRYTECKLEPIAMEILKELNKDIVEFVPNFDDTELEPTVLPTFLPNLFVNGTEGIAVGFKTEIPPHNLKELTEAIIAYIKNPNITFEEILEIMPGPDYPTGGIIINKKEMIKLYSTGNGTVSIRSKIKTEEGTYGKTNLIITEIPYTQSGKKQALIENIANLVRDKKIDGISDIRDESQGEEIRIVIEVKKGFNIEEVKHILFKKTALQDNQSCNFLVIDKNVPVRINIKDYFKLYLEFQEEILYRKYEILLNKSNKRKEVLLGLLDAAQYIDVIIEILKGAQKREHVKDCFKNGDTSNIKFKTKKNENIAKKFRFTEIQTNAILEMKLERLINLELEKITLEKETIDKNIEKYEKIISNKKNLYKEIINNLKEIQKKYSNNRKTLVTDRKTKTIKEKIVKEDLYVVIDRFGYIKTIDIPTYERTSKEDLDKQKHLLKVENIDTLYIFTKLGMLHKLKINDIPKGKFKDKGHPLDVITKYDKSDDILLLTTNTKSKLLFVMKDSSSKLVDFSEFITNRKTIKIMNLKDNEIMFIKSITNEKEIKIITNKEEYLVKINEIPLLTKDVKPKKILKTKKDEIVTSLKLNA